MDSTIEAFSAGDWQFRCQGQFSLVVFAPARVALSGDCRYAIAPGTDIKPVSSLGLSNQGYGNIRLKTDSPVFVFRDDDHRT